MAERKKYRQGQYEAECFRALPERAQEVWFQYCEMSIDKKRPENLMFINLFGIDYSECMSPIEIIFHLAYNLIRCDEGFPDVCLYPQYEIKIGNKKYIADFAFLAADSSDSTLENDDFKLVIECDGHDFHEKTKEQVTHDNEREYDLKMAGYEVLRFSGSQIYNKPFKCARQTYDYIMKKIGR